MSDINIPTTTTTEAETQLDDLVLINSGIDVVRSLSNVRSDHQRDCVYEVLAHLPNDLCVDVGAADGGTAKKIADSVPDSEIVAFEPFPGNVSLFDKDLLHRPRFRLEQLAVADCAGERKFFVPRVNDGTEEGWAGKSGYSSLGHIMGARSNRILARRLFRGGALKKLVRQFSQGHRPTVINVDSVSIDEYFRERVIDFLKIDTQGAEHLVVKGASTHLAKGGVRCVYLEYEDPEDSVVIDELVKDDFVVFDSTYVFYSGIMPDELPKFGFEFVDMVSLSSGNEAFSARLKPGQTPGESIRQLHDNHVRFHVDLIAVHRPLLEQFESAVLSLP